MEELKGLVVVVTGSGKGLGKGIAESCYAEGANVVTWDRSGAAKAVADTLDPTGKRALYVQADAVNEAQVVRAFDQVVQKFGRVDVLVNNAGISRHKPIEEMTLELFEEVMRINVTGLFLCCKGVVPIMKKQGRGKIVNISSLAARAGRLGQLAQLLRQAAAGLSGVRGIGADHLPILSLTFVGTDVGLIASLLDTEYGIEARSGLHCAPLIHRQLGSSPGGTLRISAGHSTTPEQLQRFAAALREIVTELEIR